MTTTTHAAYRAALARLESAPAGSTTDQVFPEVWDSTTLDTGAEVVTLVHRVVTLRAAGQIDDDTTTNAIANLFAAVAAAGYALGAEHVATIAAEEVVVPRDLADLFAEYAPDVMGDRPDDN